jgi:hypothetical protein
MFILWMNARQTQQKSALYSALFFISTPNLIVRLALLRQGPLLRELLQQVRQQPLHQESLAVVTLHARLQVLFPFLQQTT